jgi:hypothetical protein
MAQMSFLLPDSSQIIDRKPQGHAAEDKGFQPIAPSRASTKIFELGMPIYLFPGKTGMTNPIEQYRALVFVGLVRVLCTDCPRGYPPAPSVSRLCDLPGPLKGECYNPTTSMGLIKELLLRLRYSVALLLAGVLMIVLAQYSLSGQWNKLELKGRSSTSMVYLLTGLGLMLVSVFVYILEYDDFSLWTRCRLATTDSGFKTIYKDTEIYVDFGVLQDLYLPIDGPAVVLPANEFFDDRCFNDVHTAAGAFIRAAFDASQAGALKGLITKELEACDFEDILHKNTETLRSYGTGTCIFLDHPFGTPHRVILAAVATDREDTGLRTEMASIFHVMRGVHRIVSKERTISTIYIPLLGAGKGGVPAQLAFRALMIAVLEARCAQGGHAMKQIHLVVYQPKGKGPQVSVRRLKRAVRELVSLYQEVSR